MKKIMLLLVLASSCALAKEAPKAKQGIRKPASIECPVAFPSENYVDDVEKAINATTSCENAKEMAEACGMGSSIDRDITIVAERKCNLDFYSRLSKSEVSIFEGLQNKCNDKYKNSQGTMYISFTAFCRLNVAALFSSLYTAP
jgi:hypothetical protein